MLLTASVFCKAVTKHISFPDLIKPSAPLKHCVHQKAIDSTAFFYFGSMLIDPFITFQNISFLPHSFSLRSK